MDGPVGKAEVLRCFVCHATASSIAGRFDEAHLVPGVTCEACHGPGAAHVKAMDADSTGASQEAKPTILNSGHLNPADALDFCAACHATCGHANLAEVN